MTTRNKLIKILEATFPRMNCRLSEDFDGSKGAIWTGEDAPDIDGHAMFNHYGASMDPMETVWILGTHRKLWDLLDKHNWHAEFHDSGTVFLYNDGK